MAAHGADEHSHRTPEVGLTAAAATAGHSAMDGAATGAAFWPMVGIAGGEPVLRTRRRSAAHSFPPRPPSRRAGAMSVDR